MGKRYLSLSVHELVDFLLRRGDIDDRIYNQETMQMGSKLHAKHQAEQGNEYLSEVPVSGSIDRPLGVISLQGRADGIITGQGTTVIDEIKSTVDDVRHFAHEQEAWHFGQALCYAYLYLQDHEEEKEIVLQLTYLSQVHREEKPFVKRKRFRREDVKKAVEGYCDAYLSTQKILFDHRKARDESVKDLPFPYENFRPGQRELAKYCFGIAKHGGTFFAEAPTGIGKTMSTLYPFVKSFKEGRVEKIFYLTAKSTGAQAAADACSALWGKGLAMNASFLLAKEKVCLTPGHRCNPEDCPFAKDYYTKIRSVLKEAVLSGHDFDQPFVSSLARKHAICPFELSLDLSLYSDLVVCDYNYFFDPQAYLERYFEPDVDQSKDLVLVDEAHNLISRGRDMFSAELDSYEVRKAEEDIGSGKAKDPVHQALMKVKAAFASLGSGGEGKELLPQSPEKMEKALEALREAEIKANKKTSKRLAGPEFLNFSREANKYKKLLDAYPSDAYRIYVDRFGKNCRLVLTCLDPSEFLRMRLSRVKGAVLFSATLSPISYYQKAILGNEDSPYLLLPSPFPPENFDLMIAPSVSVRYKDRERSYPEVASYLKSFVAGKKGNYFLYFPSYEYLEKIRPYLDFQDAQVLTQDRRMNEEQRLDFLSAFVKNPPVTTVGLLVIGGAFSEGIDLADDRLIGVAIVGIGLPQVNFENDLIRDYRSNQGKDGFEIAYIDPGVNKVMQAVGRLIRSETDVGAALLLDDRYLKNEYRSLFARTWTHYEVVTSPEEVSDNLLSFYSGKGN